MKLRQLTEFRELCKEECDRQNYRNCFEICMSAKARAAGIFYEPNRNAASSLPASLINLILSFPVNLDASIWPFKALEDFSPSPILIVRAIAILFL